MASGSVTRRFLFSTSFLSFVHLRDAETLSPGRTSPPGTLCAPSRGLPPPAEALGDELQVVVGCHELLQAGELADARGDPVEVQLVGIQVELLQLGQLADGRLGEEEAAG